MAHGRFNIFRHETLPRTAAKYGKSVSQIAIRWNIQRGVTVIPKSADAVRLNENFNMWDFTLSDDDMRQITLLDTGRTEAEDPTSLAAAVGTNQWKIPTDLNRHKKLKRHTSSAFNASSTVIPL